MASSNELSVIPKVWLLSLLGQSHMPTETEKPPARKVVVKACRLVTGSPAQLMEIKPCGEIGQLGKKPSKLMEMVLHFSTQKKRSNETEGTTWSTVARGCQCG